MYCIPVLYVCIICSSVEERHCRTLELKIINQSINQSVRRRDLQELSDLVTLRPSHVQSTMPAQAPQPRAFGLLNRLVSLVWRLTIRPTIINSLFPVLVREKYHAGGRLLFIILLKTIIISRINATYTLGHINV